MKTGINRGFFFLSCEQECLTYFFPGGLGGRNIPHLYLNDPAFGVKCKYKLVNSQKHVGIVALLDCGQWKAVRALVCEHP